MNEPVARPALIVVRRPYFDDFAAGRKTIEYRLHRPPFTARVFYPGRAVRIAYNYDVKRFATLLGRVRSFDVRPAAQCPAALFDVYPALRPDDEIAAIGIDLLK